MFNLRRPVFLGITLLLSSSLLSSSVYGQPAPRAPGQEPPEALPPFELTYDQGALTLGVGEKARLFIPEFRGNIRFAWGDLLLQADRLTFDRATLQGEAAGNVRLNRGDETIRAASFRFDARSGTAEAAAAVVIAPPFQVRGERVFIMPDELRAENAQVDLRPEGGGEARFVADEVRISNETRRLSMKNARISLYGKRLLTVRHLAIPLNFSEAGALGTGRSAPPVILRASGISGTAFGVGVNFGLPAGISGTLVAEQTSRQGFQYSLGLRRSLLSPGKPVPRRRDIPVPGTVPPEFRDASPLRRLLVARPEPLPFDPVLDFIDISTIENPLSNPTRRGPRDLTLSVLATRNREIASRRQGPLLLSREPETELTWSLPLAGPVTVSNNTLARSALRKPRLTLIGDASLGRYQETRIRDNAQKIARQRATITIGLGTLPILVGDKLLISYLTSYQLNQYGRGDTYRVLETNLFGEWVFGRRTGIGLGVIKRAVGGATPFLFDQIDTQNEAQARVTSLLPGEKFTLAGVIRYDMVQGKVFDWEIALGARGHVLEPRFSYRQLNSQFGFSIGLPGLVGL